MDPLTKFGAAAALSLKTSFHSKSLKWQWRPSSQSAKALRWKEASYFEFKCTSIETDITAWSEFLNENK